MDTPFTVRVPLVPGVTDSEENLAGIARTVQGMHGLLGVDLLPYNKLAGAKYKACGMNYRPGFDETQPPWENIAPFLERGIPVRVA